MSRRKKQSNGGIIIVYDENQEGLTNSSIWTSEEISKTTSIKKEGWSGMSDFDIAEKLKNWNSNIIFITADKEKRKNNKDFFPTKNFGIVRFGKNTTSLGQRGLLLKNIVKQKGFKRLKSFIGKDIKVTSEVMVWGNYKNSGVTHTKQWRKSKRT